MKECRAGIMGVLVRTVSLPVTALAFVFASAAVAGDREEYLLCVTEELGRGTDLSEIGDLCLERVAPREQREQSGEAEEYPYERRLREVLAVEGSLFDPESAQFKDLVYSRTYRAWCGQINSKNRLGGYVGWQYFALRDRYRGRGRRAEYIDFRMGAKEWVEGTCKSYQAWVREYW